MKLQTIVLIGVGLFIVYKLGRRFNVDKSQPKLIKNTEAVLSGGIPDPDAVAALPVSAPASASPAIEDVFAMVQRGPVNRSIFPENVFEKFAVKDSGESVKTYETASY